MGMQGSVPTPAKKGRGAVLGVVGLVVIAAAVLSYVFIKHQHSKDEKTKVASEAKACSDQLGPVVTSLSDLDAKLNVGVVEADYTTAVQDVEVAWSHVDSAGLSTTCRTHVGTPAKAALDEYTQAATTWNNCITDTYCDSTTTAFNQKLNAHWVIATSEIETAKNALAAMRSSPSPG